MPWFDHDDPRCTRCGCTFDEAGGQLGGVLQPDGDDEVLCIDCMTPDQRREHAALAFDDDWGAP